MFWKMEKYGHENDLNCINAYLLSFFAFAAGTASMEFDRGEWMDFAGPDGKWLYTLYKKDTVNGTAMRQSIRDLFALSQGERSKIYEAIAHDMKFADNRTVPFEFYSIEPHLDKSQSKLIKHFYLYFYEVVLCSTQFRLSGLSGKKFDRKEFVRQYFDKGNPKLKRFCPVCLQPVTDAGRENDVEHYFGKAFVPCLALHPYNLYFVCKACNQEYKKGKNVLKGGADIRRIFLPYIDTLKEKTKLEFYHQEKEDGVRICPVDVAEPYISEKIEAFDYLFELEERWSGMLEAYYHSLRTGYESAHIDTFADLKGMMQTDLVRAKARGNENPQQYLETKYQEWISEKQLKAFYSELKQRGRKAEIL